MSAFGQVLNPILENTSASDEVFLLIVLDYYNELELRCTQSSCYIQVVKGDF